jgi:hypothetical protein
VREVGVGRGERQFLSQPDIFTISHTDDVSSHSHQLQDAHRHKHHPPHHSKTKAKKSANDSEGLATRKHRDRQRAGQELQGSQPERCKHDTEDASSQDKVAQGDTGVYRKSKHSDKRRHRDHSGGEGRGRGGSLSPGRRSESSTERGNVSTNSAAQTDDVTGAEDDPARTKHVPSKLQVKAIAARSDEDDGPARSTSSKNSTEPTYANVSAKIKQEKRRPLTQQSVASSPSEPHSGAKTTFSKHCETGDASHTGPSVDRSLKDAKLAEPQEAEHDHSVVSAVHSPREHKRHKERTGDLHTPRLPSEEQRTSDKPLADKPPKSDHKRCKDREGLGPKTDRTFPHPHHHHPHQDAQKSSLAPGHAHSRSSSSGRGDAWYVCSESEDSALPPETFSSSIDDGVSDVGSDISFELII